MGVLTIPALIDAAHQAGLTVAAHGNRLRVTGPRRQADPDLLAQLRKHKLGILGQLQAANNGITAPTVTCADGNTYLTKCPCARHPHYGHNAEPITTIDLADSERI